MDQGLGQNSFEIAISVAIQGAVDGDRGGGAGQVHYVAEGVLRSDLDDGGKGRTRSDVCRRLQEDEVRGDPGDDVEGWAGDRREGGGGSKEAIRDAGAVDGEVREGGDAADGLDRDGAAKQAFSGVGGEAKRDRGGGGVNDVTGGVFHGDGDREVDTAKLHHRGG